MKVQLTERRNVEATSQHFTVEVHEATVTMKVPGVGRVWITRNRKGLEIVSEVEGTNVFFEHQEGDKVSRDFSKQETTTRLRKYGQVTLAEMAEPELRAATEIWMKKGK